MAEKQQAPVSSHEWSTEEHADDVLWGASTDQTDASTDDGVTVTAVTPSGGPTVLGGQQSDAAEGEAQSASYAATGSSSDQAHRTEARGCQAGGKEA